MKILLSLIVFLLSTNFSICQHKYVNIFDFDNIPQFALEIHSFGEHFYLSYTGVCIDANGQLLETCSGISKIDYLGNILENILINKFTIAFKSLNIDRINELIVFSGDNYFKDKHTDEFNIYFIDINNLSNMFSTHIKDNDSVSSEYFQIISELLENKLIIGGSINQLNQNVTTSKIIRLQDNKSDTILNINFSNSTSLWNSLIDKNNQLNLALISHQTGGYHKIHIVKFDEDLNQVWHWTADIVDYIQKPYICELHDGRLVVTVSDHVAPKIASLEAINPDKSRSWKYRFPDISGKIQRRVYRIKTLKNGDIVGMGSYGNNSLILDARIPEIPYIFRMSSQGKLLWEKAFTGLVL
ncbi:MAG: hypothetical protein IPM26_06760 [Saprospiraceae bacterium]|nr:hypothetical protein [Saprospiraceae bacterium]